MTKIKVCALLKTSNLLAPEKGETLRESIIQALKESSKVILDFEGYEYISSTFLNESIGKLLIDTKWSKEKLLKKISWCNLADDDETDILIAIENAETRLYLLKNNINLEEFYRSNLPTV
jgi:hypothetical protein